MKNLKQVSLSCVTAIATAAALSTTAAAEGPPQLELHLWGGNEAVDSGSVGLRSAELASWITRRDRLSVTYDNSLGLDNPALARAGVNAEAWSLGYLHDFSGNYLVSGGVGSRSLSNGLSQDIYKLEAVRLQDNRVGKLGVQLSPTKGPGVSYTDQVIYGALNFPVSPQWRFEPAIFLGRTGTAGDDEWRFAGYAEFNARNRTQLGFGLSGGLVRSDLVGASGGVVAAHARVSWPFIGNQLMHLQLRHETSPSDSYTLALIGLSLNMPRR